MNNRIPTTLLPRTVAAKADLQSLCCSATNSKLQCATVAGPTIEDNMNNRISITLQVDRVAEPPHDNMNDRISTFMQGAVVAEPAHDDNKNNRISTTSLQSTCTGMTGRQLPCRMATAPKLLGASVAEPIVDDSMNNRSQALRCQGPLPPRLACSPSCKVPVVPHPTSMTI